MPIFSELAAGGVKGLLEGVGSAAKGLREAIKGKEIDPTVAAEINFKTQELEFRITQAQTKINEIEAAHPSVFVSGWRPAAGWTCVLGLFYMAIARPIIQLTIDLIIFFTNDPGKFAVPPIDTAMLIQLLLGLLGLGGLRAYEKGKGVNRN